MLLSQITTDPARYQFRATPYSVKTVDAIVSEGINLSKFDPIPVIPAGDGRYCVGGDGHSRFETVRRLWEQSRLPKQWQISKKRGKSFVSVDFDIPCRIVTDAEAQALAWTANLSRDDFSPCEEARVYQSMLDAGKSLEDVARLAHKNPAHVSRLLSLNSLCHDIRAAVGMSPAAGGIDVLTAQVLATGFKRYDVAPQQQQQLWHCFLKHAMLNFQSAKKFLDRIGSKLADKDTDGVLFAIPANAVAIVHEAKARGNACRSAKMGLALLLKAHEQGALEDFPDLTTWIDASGRDVMERLAARVTEDGELLADIVAPPKHFKPIAKDATDLRIERQYDASATPCMF